MDLKTKLALLMEDAKLPGKRSRRGQIVRGRSFGRRLERFKTVAGKNYQLHATKGWKPA